MSDYIKRADAIEAVAEEWLSEASAESPYVNDNDIDRYRELAEDLFADIPSADAVEVDRTSEWVAVRREEYEDLIADAEQVTGKLKSVEISTDKGDKSTMSQLNGKLDLISRADAVKALTEYYDYSERMCIEIKALIEDIPSADAVSREDYEDIIKDYRKQYENMNNEIADLEAKLSADAVPIYEDGTLEVKVPNAQKVGRVLVMDTDSHIGGGLFYPDDAVHIETYRELYEKYMELKHASANAVQGYTEWLEKIIVDNEGANEWLCEDTPDLEWCEKNCHYSSIQAECLRYLYAISKGGDTE